MRLVMENQITMLKVSNVSKVYKLGEIGGTTLKEEVQRLRAKIRKKEDPTKKIGAKNYNKGETFKALDGLSFEVKKGERVGIIGHNGAGKSTLLKLISRVTAPTNGAIYMNGRVTSMLEVGTGFHGELTGRENIYLNGAILGMTKKEIDSKIEKIIDFSEVRQFIDTPVKRYSSGMYVKLAFSVAAHLDSEIMIMDEVLAVGDMAFQNKCLEKMKTVSLEDERTILYVSHNMNTIRQLCSRVIVLSHGKIVFDGDVEKGIDMYLGIKANEFPTNYNLDISSRPGNKFGKKIRLLSFDFLDNEEAIFNRTKPIRFNIKFKCNEDISDVNLYFSIKNVSDRAVGLTQTFNEKIDKCQKGKIYTLTCSLDCSNLSESDYRFKPDLFVKGLDNSYLSFDHVDQMITFRLIDDNPIGIKWSNNYFGNVKLNDIIIEKVKEENENNKN